MTRSRQAVAYTERYHDATARLANRTAELVGELVVIDESNAVDSWRIVMEAVDATVTAAQARSHSLADGYLSTVALFESGDVELADPRPHNVGFSADGRPLGDVLVGARGRFFKDLEQGPFATAVDEARASIERVAAFETHDAGQRELLHQIAEVEQLRGFRSKSRGTCGACL